MELNGRPRKILGWKKPIEVYAEMLEAARGAMTD
jgi:IS30 family transposase